MAAGIPVQGTKIKVETTSSPSTFTAMKGVTNASGPNESTELYDDTDFDSTAKEWGYGLDDTGEFKITAKWDPTCTAQEKLLSARAGKEIVKIEIEKSNGAKVAFSALVRDFGEEYPKNEKVQNTFTLKVSGAITRTPAAG